MLALTFAIERGVRVPATKYKVETRSVAAEVSFGAGTRATGEMFLRPSIVTLSGTESVADRLNDRDAFFPLRVQTPEPATWIIGKAQVRYVAAEHDPEALSSFAREAADAVEFHVSIELDDGEELAGLFQAVLPRGKRRALDFINEQEGAFVPFLVGAQQYVLNRAFIRKLRDGDR
jgi:hypothetical protein